MSMLFILRKGEGGEAVGGVCVCLLNFCEVHIVIRVND